MKITCRGAPKRKAIQKYSRDIANTVEDIITIMKKADKVMKIPIHWWPKQNDMGTRARWNGSGSSGKNRFPERCPNNSPRVCRITGQKEIHKAPSGNSSPMTASSGRHARTRAQTSASLPADSPFQRNLVFPVCRLSTKLEKNRRWRRSRAS